MIRDSHCPKEGRIGWVGEGAGWPARGMPQSRAVGAALVTSASTSVWHCYACLCGAYKRPWYVFWLSAFWHLPWIVDGNTWKVAASLLKKVIFWQCWNSNHTLKINFYYSFVNKVIKDVDKKKALTMTKLITYCSTSSSLSCFLKTLRVSVSKNNFSGVDIIAVSCNDLFSP